MPARDQRSRGVDGACGADSAKYDPVAKQYVYTWTTLKAWAGTCREIFVGLRDGTARSARFQFK